VAPASTTGAPAAVAASSHGVVEVDYRVERRTTDTATADFAAVVDATLTDPRGWRRAGFRFVDRPGATFLVVVAEPAEVEELCRPYDVFSTYSCQIGPVVAINAERWRHATPQWTGDLASYRQMVVGHEVGHLIGRHHVRPPCPVPGRPAAVMSQQSTELHGCLPNPWPLAPEIEAAAHDPVRLAPPYEPGP
jgi:hypothetical protein